MRQQMHKTLLGMIIVIGLQGCDPIDNAQILSDFPETMATLQDNIRAKGYTISRVQRIDYGMEQAGYDIEEYRVVFFAKPEEMALIMKDYPELAPFLPLSITIYKNIDRVELLSMPYALPREEARTDEIKTMISRWEKDTSDIIEETVQASTIH
jgi:uncharacterized protein (DUF302 family)